MANAVTVTFDDAEVQAWLKELGAAALDAVVAAQPKRSRQQRVVRCKGVRHARKPNWRRTTSSIWSIFWSPWWWSSA